MDNHHMRAAGNAMVWKLVQMGGVKIIYLIRLLVLAILLTPADFGLVAIAATARAVAATAAAEARAVARTAAAVPAAATTAARRTTRSTSPPRARASARRSPTRTTTT